MISKYNSALKIFPILLVIVFGTLSCAKTVYNIKYEIETKDAKVWPEVPEIPRYRYVGELTGEKNIEQAKGERWIGNIIKDFFKWVLGIDRRKNPEPKVLQRPQTGMVDSQGRIYVTDVSRHSVFVFDVVNGELKEFEEAISNVDFKTPIGIVEGRNNNILVSDADLGLVVELTDEGVPIRKIGEDVLQRPTGLARDAKLGYLYVADTHQHNIKVFNDDGDLIDVIGGPGTKVGQFNSPTHLSFRNQLLYVTDTFNTRVQILAWDGEFKKEFGHRGINLGNFVRPKGVTTDSDGNIYVIESFHDYLLVYNTNGEFLLPVGGTGTEVGQFYLPSGVWSDQNDRIYIADMFNGRVVVLQYLGG